MKRVTLSDGWLLASGREVLGRQPQDPAYQPAGWLPVTVPTTVQAAWVAAGRAPDPWRDRQVEALRPLEEETWYYRREIVVPPGQADADRFEMVFEGVSLFATVWLNGTPVAFLSNAFHEHRVDVTRHLKRDESNCLVVECGLRLAEARKRLRGDVSDLNAKGGEPAKPYLRIPQFTFGWDFAPRIGAVGLWRPVHMLCHRGASIDDVHVATETAAAEVAQGTIETAVRSFDGQPTTLHLSLHETPDGPAVWSHSQEVTSAGPVVTRLKLPHPRLWYPHPYGEPFLYTVQARLVRDGEEVDGHSRRCGVRTVELKQDGRFTFCVNGGDVFARGANWVPPDSLTWDTTETQYRHLLGLAHDAHCNMLRVWGGGTYEAEAFYDLCDELGIMVWQDFMYACAMYPDDDPEFMASAAAEARAAVRRLRRHPSVALWCGNNECQEAWVLGDWSERAPRHLGERLYDHVLPDTVAELSPGTPYWPGSPYGGPTTRSRSVGDFHDWYSLPNWRTYDENAPLFSSEYGFRSVPSRPTVDRMISPQLQWDPHGPQHVVWKHHHGWCGWLQQILPEFGQARTLDQYIMLTQEAQATLMRYALEVYRRRMPATSGSLIWQYDEPWPAVTFSLVDYYGRPKASYHWVRQAQAPVIGLFHTGGGALSVWGVSDLPTPQPCTVYLRRFGYDGKLLGAEQIEGLLAPRSATRLCESLPVGLTIERQEHEFLHLALTAGAWHSESTHHAAPRRDWVLPRAELSAKARRVGEGQVEVTLLSPTYVHFVEVSVSDDRARYSDSFVDLLPGEARTIVVEGSGVDRVTVRAANASEVRARVG